MKKIAVVTSGGDAPGMNAAVRTIVRLGNEAGLETSGVLRGYDGLIDDDIVPLGDRSVSGIVHQGGTFLGTARSERFRMDEKARRKSVENLRRRGIDVLVVIGGDGSQRGAHSLKGLGLPVVGVASTVDNDLYGSDLSIGVDTALDIALEAIDRIRTTAESHHRAFLIEVMGKEFGYLALVAGITGGADVIVTPEFPMELDEIVAGLKRAHERGKSYALAVITDGASMAAGLHCSDYFRKNEERIGFEVRVTILGHVQRGGPPNAADRLLATRLGAAAVDLIKRGKTGFLVGWKGGGVAMTPLDEVVSIRKTLDPDLWHLGQVLPR